MNEILAPIYYVFANDPNSYFSEYAEADSFYCFQNLMINLKDIFTKNKDKTKKGIETRASIMQSSKDLL